MNGKKKPLPCLRYKAGVKIVGELSNNKMRIDIEDGLYLRHFTLADAQAYYDCQMTAEAQRGFTSRPISLEEETKILKEILAEYKKEKPEEEAFAIIYEENCVGFVTLEELNQPWYEHRANLAYCVHSDVKGKNIATRAVTALINYGFKKYSLSRIKAEIRSDNTASIRVLEKCGFEKEALLKKNCRYQQGGICDDVVYALVR